MTWTKDDTEALRDMEPCGGYVGCHPDGQSYVDANALLERAAAHIEALEARVARFETEYECHPQGGVPGCDCWECLRTRIAALEAERAEVARALRSLADAPLRYASHDNELKTLAAQLERREG